MGIWRFFTKKSGIFPDFPGFFPDFPDFTLLCKIFSNENAIKPENLTSLAIQWILPKLFVTGTKQRFIWRFFTKKSGIFPDFSRIFPDFPDFGLNNAKKVWKTTLKIRISGQNPKISVKFRQSKIATRQRHQKNSLPVKYLNIWQCELENMGQWGKGNACGRLRARGRRWRCSKIRAHYHK